MIENYLQKKRLTVSFVNQEILCLKHQKPISFNYFTYVLRLIGNLEARCNHGGDL